MPTAVSSFCGTLPGMAARFTGSQTKTSVPPGRSTRAISANRASRSPEWWMAAQLKTASAQPSGSGRWWRSARRRLVAVVQEVGDAGAHREDPSAGGAGDLALAHLARVFFADGKLDRGRRARQMVAAAERAADRRSEVFLQRTPSSWQRGRGNDRVNWLLCEVCVSCRRCSGALEP